MIDFTYFWIFVLIFILAIPLYISFVLINAMLRDIRQSIFWSSIGMTASLTISLELELARYIIQSVPVLDSPVFLSVFIGILAGVSGSGFAALSASIIRRTAATSLEKAAIGK